MDANRFSKLLERLKEDALKTVKESAPVRTGNLQSAVKARDLPNGGFEIYIDTNQAYYAPYTIEPWIHDRWHGRENPNLGWTTEAMTEFIARTKIKFRAQIAQARKYNGVKKDDK